jgi:UDP-N-acetylglucosamine 2-epimerase (non-hydrolysing)
MQIEGSCRAIIKPREFVGQQCRLQVRPNEKLINIGYYYCRQIDGLLADCSNSCHLSVAMKILFVLGTRPEAIKLAPVIKELSAQPGFCCKLCVTGQHRELLASILGLFKPQPNWNLDVMRPDQGLAYLTSAVLSGIDGVLTSFRRDRVVVQGDTTTTFAGALAAFYKRVPVAHVEAGLRTDNLYAPWPEEVNRRLVGRFANLHFAPTAGARENLVREGVDHKQIVVTGNTGIDALLWVSELLDNDPELRLRGERPLSGFVENKRLILMTGHRRESFDGGLARICNAMIRNAMIRVASRPDVAVIFPTHPNPNVQLAIEPLRRCQGIRLVEPVDYPELVFLLKQCHFVVTASGGIQEEAPSFGKPVLVIREITERPEAMELGLAKLVGSDDALLYDEMCALLELLDEPLAGRQSLRRWTGEPPDCPRGCPRRPRRETSERCALRPSRPGPSLSGLVRGPASRRREHSKECAAADGVDFASAASRC